MSPEFFLEVLVALAGGFGAYAAIRADLARMHERITATKARADDAHARLDRMDYPNQWRNQHGHKET
jgi:hypothetical protein